MKIKKEEDNVMIELVGYTGFVGSNIYNAGKEKINAVYNSKNIRDAYGTSPDVLIYSGLRAEKFLANKFPEKDKELIYEAERNISEINPKKLILISTIDVFSNPVGVNEDSSVDTTNLNPYGYNRYCLEEWAKEHYFDVLIIRLPGLYGQNIKKNFIYDYINVIPKMLKKDKMEEICDMDPSIMDYYTIQENGFYMLNPMEDKQRTILIEKIDAVGFSAIQFTDSRSIFQFYNLSRLWDDIQIVRKENLRIWHPATCPIEAGELYEFLKGNVYNNELPGKPVKYDYRTNYAYLFGRDSEYIMEKNEVLNSIKEFVNSYKTINNNLNV